MKKSFDHSAAAVDEQSFGKRKRPAEIDPATGLTVSLGCFVPVSFVAKDWNVTSRRIRALLMDGRLYGQQQSNGYWEVGYPYKFVFGTRGPSLKRQQRPTKRPRQVVDNTERRKE